MDAREIADEQTKLWNGVAGRAWVDGQELTDRAYRPFEQLLVDAVTAATPDTGSPRRVLDVGCGTGATTVAVARAVGPGGGQCVGVDISDPMIAAARVRATREQVPASFVRADAQDHAFEPDSFDVIISRFGVMFFADPVRAFANLRRAAGDAGALRLIVWRSAAENPFMTTAERIAAPLLPPGLVARRAGDGAPGQFAFADPQRVASILTASGWRDPDIQPIDVVCTLPAHDLIPHLTRFGPVGRALEEADDHTRARVIEAVRPAFDQYVHGDELRFTAACWMVGAGGRAQG